MLEEEDDDAEEEDDDDDDDDIDVSSSTFSDVSAVANDIFNRRRGRQEEKVGVGDCLRRGEDHW